MNKNKKAESRHRALNYNLQHLKMLKKFYFKGQINYLYYLNIEIYL